MAAPAEGTVIPAATTIDALCTTLFATRSGDLGSPTYAWGSTGNNIVAKFPASTTPNSPCLMYIRFEARQVWPSTIGQ